MTFLLLLLVFHVERASPSCSDPFQVIAELPDASPYADNYQDMTVLPETEYCYRVTHACNLNTLAVAPDQINLWWTRLMVEIEGVPQSTVHRIVARKRWAHVD